MHFLKSKNYTLTDHLLIPLVLSLIIITMLISGCTDQNSPSDENDGSDSRNLSNVTSIFLEKHEVQLFLTQYPNASITASVLENDVNPSSDEINLNSVDSSKPIYIVSIHQNNSSIVSWFNQDNEIIKKEFQNPLIFNDSSNRLLSYENFTFNLVKIDSDIYVTFTGSTEIKKIDYLVISGTNALSQNFKTQFIGNKDEKPDDILFNTVKLEDACPTCWRNLVIVDAFFINGEMATVLKAQI